MHTPGCCKPNDNDDDDDDDDDDDNSDQDYSFIINTAGRCGGGSIQHKKYVKKTE